MAKISKFGPQFGKPKGPRMPSIKARAPKMPGVRKFAGGGAMSDEERYGKVGAEIRRLDPEAFKNRPRTAEGNLALLKELRAKAASEPVNKKAEDAFKGMADRAAPRTQAAAISRFSAEHPYATASEASTETKRRGIDDKPIEQVAPETWGLGGALKGAAALGTAALAGRGLLRAGVANEARAAAALDAKAAEMEAARIARKKAAAAEKAAATREANKEAEVRRRLEENEDYTQYAMKRGGKVKRFASGGSVSSASRRGDGCATKGKTKGRLV